MAAAFVLAKDMREVADKAKTHWEALASQLDALVSQRDAK